ncbi:hypothetical protein [Lyngbya aestuarii]|jgi:hypothetical protein|nr:hypothetical protein [Lyngbya aestuarii]
MMLLDVGCDGMIGVNTLSHWFWQSSSNYTVIAQQSDVDLVANVQKVWNNLLQTGQLWALLIGVGVGWWIRSVLP